LSSVSDEQSHISFSGFAVLVEVIWFVHSVQQVTIGILGNWSVSIVSDGISGSSISYSDVRIGIRISAHVLNNEVANQLWVSSTTVLIGPFNGEQRLFIESHIGSPAISSLSIVLGVEQSVGIVSIGVGFVQTIV
jgi:hypothetical protein